MTATSFVGCGSGEGFAKDKYNIGVSGPLSGGAAVYGEAVKNGAELAIKEINAKLGDGETKYAFEMKDDEATTKNIATNFSSLYEKGMQVSLGCVTTGSCLEYKTYAKEKNVFCITPSATGDQVPENADNMYQMCFTDSNVSTSGKYTDQTPERKVVIKWKSAELLQQWMGAEETQPASDAV